MRDVEGLLAGSSGTGGRATAPGGGPEGRVRELAGLTDSDTADGNVSGQLRKKAAFMRASSSGCSESTGFT